ncbi:MULTISPECIES: hypothetical protein [Xenorhabdus]|uniref:hypothetical protein n=1 Tax=Xenorhabdus TaxID=626 RepID=UPI0006482AEC|nr:MULTISPECIES: hypothetical protein [Xenorhabdus]
MKTKVPAGDKLRSQNALRINEEIQALLMPLLTAVENEASNDTYLMLRAVERLSVCQFDDLTELNESFE